MLARDQFRQVFALLVVIAPTADLIDAEIGMGAIGKSDRGRCAGHLLLGDDMLEIAEAQPAILLLDRDSVEAERAHFRPELTREPVLGVDTRGERGDAV